MSDSEESVNGLEEDVQFKCRKCPDMTFTAAEKDSHRNFHRIEKEKERERQKKSKPGPKSRTRPSRGRAPSPDESEVTLFEPITAAGTARKSTSAKKRGRKEKKRDDAGQSKKRKSNKNYDDGIIGTWSSGTGA